MIDEREELTYKMKLGAGMLDYGMNHTLNPYGMRLITVQGIFITTGILVDEMNYTCARLVKNWTPKIIDYHSMLKFTDYGFGVNIKKLVVAPKDMGDKIR